MTWWIMLSSLRHQTRVHLLAATELENVPKQIVEMLIIKVVETDKQKQMSVTQGRGSRRSTYVIGADKCQIVGFPL